ncbi:MAG: hypothetical protein IPP83_17450 [Flavobacteriales bacterium]|nr:hypothetical protein [Flavobacteriales bacterium]
MARFRLLGFLGLLLWSNCSAQENDGYLPDSLAVGSGSIQFLLNTDSLYQRLTVSRSDHKSIFFDLAVCIKEAAWREDTLKADGTLSWSGTYGPATEGKNGDMQFHYAEWCYSGEQLEICLHGNEVNKATIKWLAPSPSRMSRR